MFRSPRSLWFKNYLQQRFARWSVRSRAHQIRRLDGIRVLVVGIYLADRENFSAHLVERFSESKVLTVVQRWAALKGEAPEPHVRSVTRIVSDALIPKFQLLNQVLEEEDLTQYDLILVSDDDILLPQGFLDVYVDAQLQYGFALAQPARALHSYYDHRITLRKPWCKARQTRFVEIGPVFSFTRRAFPLLVPFDSASPMGFGFDFVWPVTLAREGLDMGIIDKVSVDHSFRPQGASYSQAENKAKMMEYLKNTPHLTPVQARQTLRHFIL